VSIEIVSDADFDEEHIAGTSLSNLIMFDSQSSKPYIDSGYVEYDWGEVNTLFWERRGKEPYYPIHKNVSELTACDVILLCTASGQDGYNVAYGYFHFESLPTLSKQHNITVTITDERGRVFSDTIAMNFE
jgi:hypothetical protein